jgi:hypothetical protein
MLTPRTVNNSSIGHDALECKMLCNYEQIVQGKSSIRDVSSEFDAELTRVLSALFDEVEQIVCVYYGAYLPDDAGSDYFILVYGDYEIKLLYMTRNGLWKWGEDVILNGEFINASSWTEDNATLTLSAGVARVTATANYGGIYQEIDVVEGEKYDLIFRHRAVTAGAYVCAYKIEQYKDPAWSDYVATVDIAFNDAFAEYVNVPIEVEADVTKLRIWLMAKVNTNVAEYEKVQIIRNWLVDFSDCAKFDHTSQLRAVVEGNRILITDNVNYPFYLTYTKDRSCEYGRLGYPAPYTKPQIDIDGYEEELFDDSQTEEFMGEPGLVHCTYCYVDEQGNKSNPSPVSLAGDMQYFQIWTDVDGTQINRIRQIRVKNLSLPTGLSQRDKDKIKYYEIYLRITLYSESNEMRVLGLTRAYDIYDKDSVSEYLITLPPDYGSYADYTNSPAPISGDIAAHAGIVSLATGESEISFAGFEHDHYLPIKLNNENSRSYIDGVVRLRLDGDELGIYWFYLLENRAKLRLFDQDMATGLPVIYDAVDGGETMEDLLATENGDFDDATAGDDWTGWGDPIVMQPVWSGVDTGWRLMSSGAGYYAWCDLLAGAYKDITHDHAFTNGTSYTIRFYVAFVGNRNMRIYLGTNYVEITEDGLQEVVIEAGGVDAELTFRTYSQIKMLDNVEVFENAWNTIDVWVRIPLIEQGNVHTLYLAWAVLRAGYIGEGSFENGKFFNVDSDTWSQQKVFGREKVRDGSNLIVIDSDAGEEYGRPCNKADLKSLTYGDAHTEWADEAISTVMEFKESLAEKSIKIIDSQGYIQWLPGTILPTKGMIWLRIHFDDNGLANAAYDLLTVYANSDNFFALQYYRVGNAENYLRVQGKLGGGDLLTWTFNGLIELTPNNDEIYALIGFGWNDETLTVFARNEDTGAISLYKSYFSVFNTLFERVYGIILGYWGYGAPVATITNIYIDQISYTQDIYFDQTEARKNDVYNLSNFMPLYPSAIIGYEKNPSGTEAHNNNVTFGEVIDRYDRELRHYNLRPSKMGGMAFPLLWNKECAEVIERIIYSRTVLPLQSQNGVAILMRNGLSRFIMEGDPNTWGLTSSNLIYEQRRYGILAKESLAATPRGIMYMSESGIVLWHHDGIEMLSNQPGMLQIALRDDYKGFYIALKKSYYLQLKCDNEEVEDSFGSDNLSFSGNSVSGHDFEGDEYEPGMIITISGTKTNNGTYIVEEVDDDNLYILGEFETETIVGTGVRMTGHGYITYVFDLQNNSMYIFEGLVIDNGIELHGGDRTENANLILDDGTIKIYPQKSSAAFKDLTCIRSGRITLGGERKNATLRKIRVKSSGNVTGTIYCYSENYTDSVKTESFSLTSSRWKTLGKGVIGESFEIEINSGNNIEWLEILASGEAK